MRPTWIVSCGLLAGCMGGANQETLLFELRVVAAIAEPAAVLEAGESYDLEVWVADPEDLGADVLVWACDGNDDCLPQTTTLPAGEPDAPFVVTRPATAGGVWMLACPPEACGNLDEPALNDLRDPFGWLNRLPLAGVSAASRLSPLVLDGTKPATNPKLVTVPGVLLDREAPEVPLVFSVRDADTAFGYATSGGFDAPQYEVGDDGTVTLTWLPDIESGPGELYVVFTNPAGGAEVWRSNVP